MGLKLKTEGGDLCPQEDAGNGHGLVSPEGSIRIATANKSCISDLSSFQGPSVNKDAGNNTFLPRFISCTLRQVHHRNEDSTANKGEVTVIEGPDRPAGQEEHGRSHWGPHHGGSTEAAIGQPPERGFGGQQEDHQQSTKKSFVLPEEPNQGQGSLGNMEGAMGQHKATKEQGSVGGGQEQRMAGAITDSEEQLRQVRLEEEKVEISPDKDGTGLQGDHQQVKDAGDRKVARDDQFDENDKNGERKATGKSRQVRYSAVVTQHIAFIQLFTNEDVICRRTTNGKVKMKMRGTW